MPAHRNGIYSGASPCGDKYDLRPDIDRAASDDGIGGRTPSDPGTRPSDNVLFLLCRFIISIVLDCSHRNHVDLPVNHYNVLNPITR